MTPADFQRLALALPGAEQGAHMGAIDFRVGGRIFATLAHAAQGYGNLMLTPEAQQDLLADAPHLFLPVPGGWGRMGATHIRLASATEAELSDALRVAWILRMEKNSKTTSANRKPAKKAAKKSAAKKTATKAKAPAKKRTPKPNT
ncbi:YjbR protein [Bryocella elongata]|uniref:YjbR protein n=1 Tax=Bryocella elongata TaxID=863522 RepID=A0A1H5WYY4_9BACT|nr:MmcQ/YjbR family DNA-binding protein [Bryocella elongata]SEG04744.1 YjbR protein [Bryocella elongata]